MTEVKKGLSSLAVYSAVLSALSDEGGSPRIKGRTTFRAPPLLRPCFWGSGEHVHSVT